MNTLLLILGMTAVTYLPRMVPALFMDRFQFPAWFRNWLKNIPYAALGALIFPGVLLVDEDQPLVGVVGGLVAGLLAYFRVHIIYIMTAAILAVLVMQNLL
ncbi:MAG: hypothetical protein MAG431_02486 [Chloroflexi bacterium]|nr:hypothetical protein [Chloroflexota bacterium]